MAKQKLMMKAPAGTNSANIEGHEYDIPKSGIIEVISPNHVETLVRHGFVQHFESAEDLGSTIDGMDDKEELVQFIEERGGEADVSMGLKKLRRLAHEVAASED